MASTDQNLKSGDQAVAGDGETSTIRPGFPSGSDEQSALKQALEEAQAKAQRHYDQWLRAQAEMENLRKRMTREVEGAHKFAIERFAGAILSVKDSLELGMSAAKEAQDVATLREGMELTLKQLQQALEKFNIREINPQGQAFNPEHHQAMMTQESTEYPPNMVLSVMTKGYLLNDRLLRPAVVIVSKASGT